MSSTQKALENDLTQISIEIKADKIINRQKAFERLEDILDNRTDEINRVFIYSKQELSWTYMFNCAFDGLIKQSETLYKSQNTKGLTTVENKNFTIIKVTEKLVNAANKDNQNISYADILDKVFEIYDERNSTKYFGLCFSQILLKNVLNSKGNLLEIKLNEWSRLLSYLMDLIDKKEIIMQKIVAECLAALLEQASQYSHLMVDYAQYLPQLQKLINETEIEKVKYELIKVAYSLCKNIAVDNRYAVCEFTENVLGEIIKCYKTKQDDEIKKSIFKMAHLALIAHDPSFNDKLFYAHNKDLWIKIINSIQYMVEKEIKTLNCQINRPKILSMCEILIKTASKLSHMIFWNENHFINPTNENKRIKRTNKLQSIMDMIELGDNKFCWRWFVIMADLLEIKPELVSAEDYQPLLNLLFNIQSIIECKIQVKAFYICCKALLTQENKFEKSKIIDRNFCTDLWNKIAQVAFRAITSNKMFSSEYNNVLQILLKYKKSDSENFVSNIIEAFATCSIKRTDQSFLTLLLILQTYNLNTSENNQELRKDLLNWLYRVFKRDQIKSIIMDNAKIDPHILAKVTTACILINDNNYLGINTIDNTELTQYETFINKLENDFLTKSLYALIISKLKNEIGNTDISEHPLPNDINFIIIENVVGHLCQLVSNENNTDEENLEKLLNILSKAEICLHILNELINVGALNKERFNKCELTKKLQLKLQEIEICSENLKTENMDLQDINKIIDGLINIFKSHYHIELRKLIRAHDFANTIDLLNKYTDVYISTTQSRIISYINIDDLSLQQKIKLKIFTLLSLFGQSDGVNFDTAFNIIASTQFNLFNNFDIYLILNIIKIISKQNSTELRAEWILTCIKEICQNHHKSQSISEVIIDLFQDFVNFVKPYPSMTKNASIVLNAFIKKCSRRIYCPNIAIKVIQQIKYLTKCYPEFYDTQCFQEIYISLINFLKSTILNVQLAVIETIGYILNKSWLLNAENNNINLHQFYSSLIISIDFKELFNEKTSLLDSNCNINCVSIQLLITIICVNYLQGKPLLFFLIDYFYLNNITEGLVKNIFICVMNTYNLDLYSIVEENLEYLLINWIKKSYTIDKFPWYTTKCNSLQEFNLKFMDIIIFCLFKENDNQFNSFCNTLKQKPTESLMKVLPKCLAFLTPIYANVPEITQEYKTIANLMHKNLLKYLDNKEIENNKLTNAINIIENLLLKLTDNDLYKSTFDIEQYFYEDEFIINYNAFQICLNHLKTNGELDKTILIFDICLKYPNYLHCLINKFKAKISNSSIIEVKEEYFFKYFILLKHISQFLIYDQDKIRTDDKSKMRNIQEFFIRDICSYFINILSYDNITDNQMLYIICKALEIFIKKILPKCASYFYIYVNDIVSAIIPLLNNADYKKLHVTSLNILNYLIINQKNTLKDGIILIDNFPDDNIFSEMKNIYNELKYKNSDISLKEEIIHFLKIKNRKKEGLVALKEILAIKKTELCQLYTDLNKMRGFSEDCEKSILHLLICQLIDISQCNDPEKSLEAVKCLGELGPANLTTLILKPDSQIKAYKMCESFETKVENLYNTAIKHLQELIVHKNIDVLIAASSACSHLFNSYLGKKYVENYPFLQIYIMEKHTFPKLLTVPSKKLQLSEIILKEENKPYSDWIKGITYYLFNHYGDTSLCNVAAVDTLFAETMFIHLIHLVLLSVNNVLEETVSDFFKKYFELSVIDLKNNDNNNNLIYLNKSAIKIMLSVSECIRMFYQEHYPDKTIKINFQHIAKAAQFCEAHFTSIMYSELWSLEIFKKEKSFTSMKNNEDLQQLMQKGYLTIGDTDAISAFLDPVKSRLTHFHIEKAWGRVLLECEGKMKYDEDKEHYQNSLINSGLYNLAKNITQNDSNNYECLWRLSDWNDSKDLNTKKGYACTKNLTSDSNEIDKFEKLLYISLKHLHNRDQMGVHKSIKSARYIIVNMLKHINLECSKNVYKNLLLLKQLQEIEEFSEIHFAKTQEESTKLLSKWVEGDTLPYHDFETIEPILAQRVVMLNTAGIRAKRTWVPEVLHNTILTIANLARKEGYTHIANRNLSYINTLNLPSDTKAHVLIEDARLNWSLGDKYLAKRLLEHVLNDKQYSSSLSQIIGLRLFGQYLAETQSENLTDLINKYFKKSLSLLQKISKEKLYCKLTKNEMIKFELDNNLKTYTVIAKYVDNNYTQINLHIKSAVYENKKKCLQRNQELLSIMKKTINKTGTSDEKRSYLMLEKNIHIDLKDIKESEEDRKKYLTLAFIYYMRHAILNPAIENPSIFRIISLWIANKNDLTNMLKEELQNIASYKFLQVLPQLAAQLSNRKDEFTEMISTILEKCATDHPHHTIFQILSLVNTYKDTNNDKSETQETDPRVMGANILLNKLKENNKLLKIINQAEKICTALITFANTIYSSENRKPLIIPNDLKALKNLDLIQCPTIYLPLSINCNYTNISYIYKWSENVKMVGGINAPKRISCITSNGLENIQLLKGKDDLRQDSVMQQVFRIMNTLLQKNIETNKKKLLIRTYTVVPLSQRSGILEWCVKTTPLGMYLTGMQRKIGAHQKYYPNDMSIADCREAMKKCAQSTNEKKLKTFMDICNKLQPAFQHFFFEHFQNPAVWFERRLAYVNSVATTSMVGYILGLGDRHVQNILIDKNTAEIIHIDFGIAFEQGRVLPTPETVPFRLSRDIVSPMGVSGVDGVFRKSCEKTMNVLRINQTTILTILEVLLYDPLYAWTLTNKKAYGRQKLEYNANNENEIIEEKNTTAERVLLRLSGKLNGTEDGVIGMSSIEVQVARLIDQAINPTNLSKLFVGWQPYL